MVFGNLFCMKLKKKLGNDSTKMNILKNTTYNVLEKENNLLRVLSENEEFSDSGTYSRLITPEYCTTAEASFI